VVRVALYADSNIGVTLSLFDATGTMKTRLTETDGFINGRKILTE
jgi:hypothetical protein